MVNPAAPIDKADAYVSDAIDALKLARKIAAAAAAKDGWPTVGNYIYVWAWVLTLGILFVSTGMKHGLLQEMTFNIPTNSYGVGAIVLPGWTSLELLCLSYVLTMLLLNAVEMVHPERGNYASDGKLRRLIRPIARVVSCYYCGNH